ncbi:hypothetical protein COY95_04725 [Candidatus Woesearchaeota archaeon CG_4_10_14_0_8_um_filter_47_5]|nr:MAG: hypothetical protein COY95_04725 [Candidatus Woesearchaeota archaeon CG_4_10_14_0_8_um_filter_47_5]
MVCALVPAGLAANQNVTRESVNTYLGVQNTVPAIDSITLHDSDNGVLDLTPATTTTITCNGVVRDEDGFADITSVNATIYRSSSTKNAVDSYLVHYTDSICTTSGGSGKTLNFECTFDVWFHADPGTWYCDIKVKDTFSAVNSTTPDSEVLGVLMAIDVADGTIDYGAIPVGRNTDTHGNLEQNKVVENEGNVLFDLNLDGFAASSNDGKAMSCASGDIAVGYQHWSLASGTYGAAIPLPSGGDDVTAFNLAEASTASGTPAPTTDTVYFHMEVPSTPIVSGACTGIMQFTAIQNA